MMHPGPPAYKYGVGDKIRIYPVVVTNREKFDAMVKQKGQQPSPGS
jgi:hypothetical protein